MKRAAVALLVIAAIFVPTIARADRTIRVATTPIELGAEILYAQDEGFFKKNGVTVDLQLLDSGAAILAAVASGALDIAQANLVSIATAHERSLPFVVIAPAGLYSANASTTSLLVSKTSPIRSAKELEDKTVAINGLRNITQIGLSAWMDQNGGDYKKLRFVEMPFAQMSIALEAGRVDAAIVAEPERSIATVNGARVIAEPYTAIGKKFLVGAWVTTSLWAKTHPDDAKRFATAITQAGVWANTHHAESARVLEKYTKIHVISAMRRTTYAERLRAADIQPLLDAAAQYGSLKAAFRASELLTPGL